MGFESFQRYGPRREIIILRERVMVSPLSSHLDRSRLHVYLCVPYILNASRFEFCHSITLEVRARRSQGRFFEHRRAKKSHSHESGGLLPRSARERRSIVCWIAIAMEEFTVSIKMMESMQL